MQLAQSRSLIITAACFLYQSSLSSPCKSSLTSLQAAHRYARCSLHDKTQPTTTRLLDIRIMKDEPRRQLHLHIVHLRADQREQGFAVDEQG